MARVEEAPFFVRIEEPAELRRTLLESSKSAVLALQRFERFKDLRREKAEEIENLKNVVKELVKLNAKFKASLPKTKLRFPAKKMESEELYAPEEEYKPAKRTEIEKLDSALSEIESKLSSL